VIHSLDGIGGFACSSVSFARFGLMQRIFLWLWTAFLCIVLLIWNLRAYAPVKNSETSLAQLRFISAKLKTGTAEEMQRIFPEGFFFSWALYGLANAQLAAQLEDTHPERPWLLENALEAMAKLESEAGSKIFPKELKPPHGAFYNGWLLYLQGQIIRAIGVSKTNRALLERYERGCQALALALEQSQTPFLQSYTHLAWAADNAIAIGALGIHDQILKPSFKNTIQNWVQKVKPLLEPPLYTLAHRSDYLGGKTEETTRGSSLAMIILALAYADPDFAKIQYQALREHFFATPIGIPAILEYPRGSSGSGDVDSGPIILGFSGPSIIVGMGAAITMNDLQTARVLNGFVETGGLATHFFGQRAYLLGALPIGDAFLVWVRTMTPQIKLEWQAILPSFWAWGLHLISLLFLARIGFGLRKNTRK
jgi:hypothetical protein